MSQIRNKLDVGSFPCNKLIVSRLQLKLCPVDNRSYLSKHSDLQKCGLLEEAKIVTCPTQLSTVCLLKIVNSFPTNHVPRLLWFVLKILFYSLKCWKLSSKSVIFNAIFQSSNVRFFDMFLPTHQFVILFNILLYVDTASSTVHIDCL